MPALIAMVAIFLGTAAVSAAPNAAWPTRQLTGTWTRLPALPDAHGVQVEDAVRLADGRVAALMWARLDDHGPCVAVYSPSSSSWASIDLTGDPTDCFGSQEQFAVTPDGRIHSAYRTIDTSADPWVVAYSPIRSTWEANETIGVTDAGQLYLLDNIGGSSGSYTQLYRYDPDSGAVDPAARFYDHLYYYMVGGTDRWVHLVNEQELGTYLPGRDEWRIEGSLPVNMRWTGADLGPDGRIFVTQFDGSPYPVLFAWDPSLGEWLIVEGPPDLSFPADPTYPWEGLWGPSFVDGGNGQLYAIDALQSYVFTPGEVVPFPSGEGGGGTVPDTAMGDRRPPIVPLILLLGLGWFVLAAVRAPSTRR